MESTENAIVPNDGMSADLRALLQQFGQYVDQAHGAIGRVVASEKEPSGSHEFYIWARENERALDVGHIVVAFSEEALVIGVVDQPRRFSDLRSFMDDFFDMRLEEAIDLDPAMKRPEILVFKVNVLATCHLRDDVTSHRPPVAGPVYYATKAAIEKALNKPDFSGVAIPALMHVNGNLQRDASGEVRIDEQGREMFQKSPIWLDADYLLGPEAGHANWTGQSGLATKTSHALFLTSATFQRMEQEGKSVAAVFFNVKGPDLLWLDKSAAPEDPQDIEGYRKAGVEVLGKGDLESYAAFGLEPRPFRKFSIFAPFRPNCVPQDQTGRLDGVRDLRSRLNTLRQVDGQNGVVFPVLWNLKDLLRYPHRVFEYSDLDDKMWGFIDEIRQREVETFVQLNSLFEEIEAHREAQKESGGDAMTWNGHNHYTIQKAKNRLKNLARKFNGLVADGNVGYGALPLVTQPFGDQEVRVIDIAQCNTNIQEMLVTSVINDIWWKAENGELGVEKVIIFVDELNKYAPNGGEGGLRDTLVDIAARGRHLNVVLFGAQQFRSKVESEILGNCGTSFYGRIGDEEIVNAAYRSLSDTAQHELLGLPKGTLLSRHSHFRAPLFGTFPRPPMLTGMQGQRVFNPATGNPLVVENPALPLVNLLEEWGVSVTRTQILTEAEGLGPAEINSVCDKLRQAFDGSPAENRRKFAWANVEQQLAKRKQRNGEAPF